MFRRIDIRKFGLYKDFTWKGLTEFGRLNIIYGRNYSGKTTLSRIFDSMSMGMLHKDYIDGEFTIQSDKGSVNQTNLKDCPYAVRVYNSDYVNRNLSWLKDEDAGEIKPFALIGSDNVEAQKAIEEIDEKLGSVENKRGLLYENEVAIQSYKAEKAKFDESTTWLENQLRTKANGDIKTKNYYVKQGTNYIINNIKRDIEQFLIVEKISAEDEHPFYVFHKYSLDDKVVLTEEVKQRLRKTIDEVQKNEIKTLPETEPHLKAFEEQVRELVTKKITLTQTLQELVNNELLQTWVEKGRELHKDSKTCAFCGNLITTERWEALDAHFSKESEELKQSLQNLKETLENAHHKLDDYLTQKGFTKENIYVANIKEYEVVMEQWNEYVAWYQGKIEGLIKLIDERLGNIFKPLGIVEFSVERLELVPILQKINALIEVNNGYGLKLNGEKQIARDRLRLDYVYHYCTDIHYAETRERIEQEEAKMKEKSAEMIYVASVIGDLMKRRKQKELDKKDEGKAAQKVTELLYNHFGNGSLSLEPETVEDDIDMETGEIKPRTRFVVKRGGKDAKNLSEGERSLISFCYFIAQMADELNGAEASSMVIYIDDPISSLDNSHIFFMYSLIDSVIVRPTNFGQLFVSTHNLEFLKFMKRFKLRGPKGTKNICHYVVVKLGKGTTGDYRCEVREMPKYLKKYMTEYNFLFEQIYEIANLSSEEEQTLYGEKYTLYYNIGNNMRKFLECYLFNRYPDAEEPLTEHLKDLFEEHVPSEVNRVINEYSHLIWSERGMKVMDVPEVVSAAREILKALQTKDRGHYDTLCKSVDKDANIEFVN